MAVGEQVGARQGRVRRGQTPAHGVLALAPPPAAQPSRRRGPAPAAPSGACAPGAATRPPAPSARRGSGAASARRAAGWPGPPGHALVVGHEALHHGPALLGRQPVARVVDGLVEAVGALAALGRQVSEVADRRTRPNHHGQGGGVGGDHQVAGQAALQAQAGHAERLVLVVEGRVHGVEGRLGDAPGHAALPAVLDLAGDGAAAAVVEQRFGHARQQQPRHQVLEHGAAPGEQARPAGGAGERPAELEPVLCGTSPRATARKLVRAASEASRS